MNKIKYNFYILSTALFLIITPVISFAQGGSVDPRDLQGIKNPIKSNTIMNLLEAILDIFIRVGTPLIVLAFIYVGFRFVTAQGNESKLTTAKSALLYTVIGTAVLLGAKAISMLIAGTVDLF